MTPFFYTRGFLYFRLASLATSSTERMPVVKTPAVTHRKSFFCYNYLRTLFTTSPPLGLKAFSPYTMSQCHPSRLEQSSCIKIRAPYIDGDYSSPDFAPYGDCNGKVGYAHCLIPFISFGHVQISPLLPTPNVQVPYIRKKICLTQVSRSFLLFEPLLID